MQQFAVEFKVRGSVMITVSAETKTEACEKALALSEGDFDDALFHEIDEVIDVSLYSVYPVTGGV